MKTMLYAAAGVVFGVLSWVLHERIQLREDNLTQGYLDMERLDWHHVSPYRQRRLARRAASV